MEEKILVVEEPDTRTIGHQCMTYIMSLEDAYEAFGFNNVDKCKDTGKKFSGASSHGDWTSSYQIYTYCMPETWSEGISTRLAFACGIMCLVTNMIAAIAKDVNVEALNGFLIAWIGGFVFSCFIPLIARFFHWLKNASNKETKKARKYAKMREKAEKLIKKADEMEGINED